MNVTAQKFQSSYALVCKSLAWSNHRTTLPQLRCAQQLPQRVSRETSPHNANHPPAGCCVSGRVIFWLCVGGCFAIHPGACETVGVRATFVAPTKAQKFLRSTTHRGTLPQSALRAASSLREGAGKCSHSTGYSLMSGVTGDFHRPYEGSEGFTFCFFILPGLWLWQVCFWAGG